MFKSKRETQETIALFGGSFDPPHFGHKSIIKEALKTLNIDKLVVIPTFLNPFKTGSSATPHQRLEWSKAMFESFPRVEVNSYEIEQGKTTTTATTLSYFQKKYHVKYLIIGADNLASIEKWYNFDHLNSQITWVIATRAEHKIETAPLRDFKLLEVNVDISSTKIRDKKITRNKILMNINERVERIVTELDTKKAEEIEVFNLEEVDYIAKQVVLANSLGGRHSSALATHLKDKLKPLGEEFLHVDESDDWVVID